MKTLLLVTVFQALGFAMTWQPFPNCTETRQLDSIRTLVWIDEGLIPENAPYRGHVGFRYHPGTCFVARTEQKPYYLDSTMVVEVTLSPDLRRQDFRWIVPGPEEYRPHGTRWFSSTGEIDSVHHFSFALVEGRAPVRNSFREIHRRSAQSLTITSSIRRGEGPWVVYARDSVVAAAGTTTIHTVEEEGSYVTHCAPEGATFVCTPTPIGEVTTDLNKQVWHLTGNRPDSLRTYLPDGRLESTDHWFWSPRVPGTVRRLFPRAFRGDLPALRYFNVLGRRL